MNKIDFTDLDELVIHGDEGSYFDNGQVVLDKDVAKEAFKRLSLFDRIFRPDKVATTILVAHSIMCESVQGLKKENG